jgi:hypothetical protein
MPGYTSELYNYISTIDPTFKNDVSLDQFKSKMSDVGYSKNMYDWIGQSDKTFHSDVSFDSFREKLGYKKKEPTVSPSVQKPKPISSGTQPKATQKPSGTSVSGKPEGLYSVPGNELAVYKKSSDGWYVDNNRSGNFIKLQKGDVEKRTAALEKNANKLFDPDYEQNISWQKAPEKKELKSTSKESQITERQFEEPIRKELAQKAFDEEFFITPKKGMSSVEQVDFVAKEKAKKELGENATPEALLDAEQKYKVSGTLKMLQRKGYDVDINGTLDDPKAKKALAEFNASEQLRLNAEAKQNKLSSAIDNIVDSKLMGLTEEQVVPQLNRQFGKYGFEFQESGLGSDAMTVRYSADGITYTDELDIDLQSGDPASQMNILKSFMNKKYLNDSEIAALNDEKLDAGKLVKITSSDPQKYAEYALSEGQFENYITSAYRGANDLKKQIDSKILDFSKLSQEYQRTGDENLLNQLKTMESSIKNDQEKLTYTVADLENTESKYKETVGSYILQKEKQGNFIGGIFASAAKGIASAPKMLMNVGVDILPEMLPNAGLNPLEYQKMKDEGFSDAQIKNKVSSQLKRTIGKEINQGLADVGSLGTVQNEYFSSVDRNILEQAVFGLSESVGAAASGGGNSIAQGLAFFGMSYNAMQDELSSKEFDELDKWEKQAISGVYGLVIGQLEKIGFNMSAGQMKNPFMKKFVSNVVKGAIKDMPENATIETVDQLIGTSLKNTMRATGAKIINGALSEGSTEGIQSLAETGMKNIVNEIHNKKVFQYVPDLTTKEGIADALGSALYEAAAGAIGGAIMGSFDTYRQSRVNEQSDEKFQNMYQSLMDDNTLKAVKLNEIEKYKNGDISKDQMQSNIREINNTVSLLNKIPTELDTRGKRVALELLSEKEGLQTKIQGKDPNLVSTEINRIAEIDNQLKTIGENAIKESNIEEVTAEGGGLQREGAQEGQPQVGEGEGPVGQAAQPETDLGNRPVEGRGVQEEGVETIDVYHGGSMDEKTGDIYVTEEKNQATEYAKGNQGNVIKYTIPKNAVASEQDVTNAISELGIEVNDESRLYELIDPRFEETYIGDDNKQKLFDSLKNKGFEAASFIDEDLSLNEKQGVKNIVVFEAEKLSPSSVTVTENEAENLYDQGYRPVIDGQIQVDYNKENIGDLFEKSDRAEMSLPTEPTSTERKITSSLETKINQYETEQAAEGIGNEETVTTDEGKEVKRVKLREPKESNAKAALAVDTANNPRLAVLKYFVSGGKINSTALQKLYGDKQGKSIKGEVQSRIGLIDNKKGRTAEQIAESLWMEYGEQFGMNDTDFLPYVEEVISEFKGTKGMISELLSAENKSEEDYYKQMYGDNFEGYDNSEIEQAESVLDYMTDEEIIQMANDIEVAEKEFIEEKLKQEATVEQPIAEEPKTIDKAISFLEDLENKLDKFGKETLGVNIPVAVLKSAVNVAKTSLKAGKQIADAISDAVDYIKSTDFYKNITEEDKAKIESDVNDLFTGKKTFEDISEVKEKTIEKLSDLIGENKKDVKTIVSISKENNFSDNIIRDYIKQQGYSDKEATNAINEYNIKKEDIWIANKDTKAKSIASSLKSFRKRLFSARSFLPKSVFGYKEKKDAEIARELNIVDQNVTDFNRLYAKYKGDQEQLLKDFDAYIRGDKTVELPEEFIDTADSMRNQIDNLSRQLIDNGLVDADMAQKIKDNLGQYLTRSYKLYDRENWKSEVEEEVKQKAINFLRSQYRSMAQELADKEGIPVDEVLDNIVNNKVDEMLTTEGASNFIKGSKLGAKDLSVLKEKQDIPFEIRALMGEYSDPALNYAKTVLKLSSLAANHNFLTEVKNAGMGVYLFEKNDPRRPSAFNTMIAAEGSKGMNPLNGLYTTKEIAESFEAQASQLSDFMRLFMKFQSSIRWAKTIGSVATHMKNVIGNLGFIFNNAHFNPKALSTSYKTIKNDFTKGNRQELRDKMNNYISLGIVKQSAGLGEIMDMFKDADWDTAMASRLSNEKIGILGKAKRFLLQGKKKLEDAYQAEDDFFKIIAYENELSRYSEAMFDKDKKDLTEDELKQVNDVVTEIVKNTYPTYDRIPEAIKMIRRAPFIGNFVSFQAEAYRTAFNTMALAKSELESDNPKIKLIGAKRLVGATSYISAKTAILQFYSMAAGSGLTGVIGYLFDDDDEEQRDKDIREFVAPWSKESDLIVLDVGGGKLKYIDFSASDPHGGIKKVLNAFLLGESTTDSFIDGIISTVSPFVGEEMTTEALLELKNNQDKYGKQIWNPEESIDEQTKKILAHIYKLVEPGTFSSIRRGIQAEDKQRELVANIAGFRTYDVDINEQFGFKVRDYSERIKNAKKIYNSVFYNEESTKKQKEDAYNKANESLSNIYQEIIDIYDSAERLGVDPKDLKNTMNDFGNISKRDAFKIKKGEIPSLKLKR